MTTIPHPPGNRYFSPRTLCPLLSGRLGPVREKRQPGTSNPRGNQRDAFLWQGRRLQAARLIRELGGKAHRAQIREACGWQGATLSKVLRDGWFRRTGKAMYELTAAGAAALAASEEVVR